MNQYKDLLDYVLSQGVRKDNRTGVPTIGIFGYQMRFDLSKGFPLLTTKKVHFKSVVYELLWFLKGDTNIEYLNKNGVRIWDEWANSKGDLGPIYGSQWRDWDKSGIDQINQAIDTIKKDPNSRRIIVSAWNPKVLPDTSISFEENVSNGKSALPPCHTLFQFYVSQGSLSCQLYQRSADAFLGVPFNIASYSLLTCMMASICNLRPGFFIHTFGDLHIYENHIDQVKLQLTRDPKSLPILILNPKIDKIDDFEYEDIQLQGYDPHPLIKGNIAV